MLASNTGTMTGMSPTPTSPDLSDEAYAAACEQRWELVNWARITYRYHRKRQRFFDVCDKLTQMGALAGGVLVAGKALTDHLPLLGSVIAFSGLMALLFGFSERRQSYKELAEQAMALQGEIVAVPAAELTPARLAEWDARRCAIDLKEPPNLKTLVAMCEWEQAVADGHPEHCARPTWWQQAYMHFV